MKIGNQLHWVNSGETTIAVWRRSHRSVDDAERLYSAVTIAGDLVICRAGVERVLAVLIEDELQWLASSATELRELGYGREEAEAAIAAALCY